MGTTHVAIKSNGPQQDLGSYLKIGRKTNPKVTKLFNKVQNLLDRHGVDPSTCVALLQSYERKFGSQPDLPVRLSKFLKFIESVNGKEDLLDTVCNVGLLSKQELEDYGNETGDWTPFLKKVDKEKAMENTHEPL